jgi:hypothetical protein
VAIKRKTGKPAAKAAPAKVSRRQVNAPPSATKSKAAKPAAVSAPKKAKKEMSVVVKDIQEMISRLSQGERKYYEKVRDLVGEHVQSEVLRLYDIGKQLLECQLKFPQSDAHKTIVMACGITDAHGRLYRKLAERFTDRAEIERYVSMSNAVTGWRIPLTTLYSIGQRSNSAKQREKYVIEVIDEQMSQETFDQRHPNGLTDDGEVVEVRIIRGASVIKKIQTGVKRLEAEFSELTKDSVMSDLGDPDIKTINAARDTTESLRGLKNKIDVAIDSLEHVVSNNQDQGEDSDDDSDEFEEELPEDDGYEDDED